MDCPFAAYSCNYSSTIFLDEFRGHSLLEGSRQSDLARVKKYLSSETVNFKHPYTGDTPLVHRLEMY